MTDFAFLEKLFPGGQPLFYEGTFNGKSFTRHWCVFDKHDEKGYRFEFYLEFDRKAVGQGGSMQRQKCALRVDNDFAPIAYVSESTGARMLITMTPDLVKVTMPDGSKPEVKRDGAQWVVEANITGLDALFLAFEKHQGKLESGDAESQLFLLNKLLPIPYKLSVTDEPGLLKSSYEEEIRIDPDGKLLSVFLSRQGVKYENKPAPPLPEWRNEAGGTAGAAKQFPKYRPPAGATFKVEDVSIAAPAGSIGGTITTPAGTGPFPAVLFLSGTGTHNRHGIAGEIDLGSHEIVDHLSNNGFFGLRFDTRGAGSTRSSSELSSSLAPLFEDARACLAYLRGRPEIDPSRIFLVGHSQGGVVAMVLAADAADPPVRGIAMLASLGRPLDEILNAQMLTMAQQMKLTDEQRDRQMEDFHQFLEAVRSGKKFEAGEVAPFLVPLARDTAFIKDHLDAPPAKLMKSVHCPVYVAQGASDFQVTVQDAELLEKAAKDNSLKVEMHVFPDLDHLFKHTQGQASNLDQYHDLSRRVDAGFLDSVLSWLRGNA